MANPLQTLWTQAKTDLAGVVTAFTALQAALAALENDRVALYNFGLPGGNQGVQGWSGNFAQQWLALQVRQLGAGWQPYPTTPEGPARVVVYATDPNRPRDLTLIGDTRPIQFFDPMLT